MTLSECVLTDRIVKRLALLVLPVVAVAVLTGCATNPDAGDQQLADSQAAFGTTQTQWKAPFWERWAENKSQTQGSQAASTTAAPTPTRVAATTATAGAVSTPAVGGSGLRPKVGVYIAGGDRDSLVAYQFLNALEHNAAANGVSIVTPDSLAEAIGVPGVCSSSSPAECAASLAIYPGVRALMILEPKASGSGRTSISTRMIDTDFDIEYEPIETALDLTPAGGVQDAALGVWSDRMLALVQDRISIAPWFTHTFALDGDDMYVSAGRDSGLAAGTMLTVRDAGSVVRAPSGRAVAWKPGAAVGEVRVKQLVGSHLALAEQVSGKMPVPRDKLTVSE